MGINRILLGDILKLKYIGFLAIGCFAVFAVCLAVLVWRLPSVKHLADPEVNLTIQVKDWKGNSHPLIVGPQNRYWTPSDDIPPEMKWSVVVAEDANFYQHEGIDLKAMKNALKYDLEKRRFARGASTITQQVAKNLFLSREKTLTRKLEEIILAKRMEHELSKGRILELYLGVVELGPMVYSVGHGAQYYFGKRARDLSPRECAFLAAMLPGPQVVFNPYKHLSRVLKRSDMILGQLHDKGVLSGDEYRQALAEMPNISGMQRKVDQSLSAKVARFFQNVFKLFP